MAIMNIMEEKRIGAPHSVDEKQSHDHGYGSISEAACEHNGVELHPQPTDDQLDPLNWSTLQKNTILGIVMLKYVRLVIGYLPTD